MEKIARIHFIFMLLSTLIAVAVCRQCQPNTRKRLLACYPFDEDLVDYWKNNTAMLSGIEGYSDDSICGTSILFDGATKITVGSFRNHTWGERFGVSLWFKRTAGRNHYQGIVNNGYSNIGSWEIRMGREFGGSFLGGGVVTADSSNTWDYQAIRAAMDQWHHVAISYNGKSGRLKFWLDGILQDGDINCCTGPILIRDTPMTIGQDGVGKSSEYFYGLIDELRVFAKILTARNVRKLYKRPCGD